MANLTSEIERDRSLTATESGPERFYRYLLVLLCIFAFGGTGIAALRDILWRQPVDLGKPNFNGAVLTGLMGLGFIFGSFYTHAQQMSKPNLKNSSTGLLQLLLMLTGVAELCITGFAAYSNLKALGY